MISVALTLLAFSGHGIVTTASAQESDEAALRAAARGGRIDDVRALLDQGVDVNAKDKGGRTPLILAAWKQETEVMNLLLERGADVNAKDKDGGTPLMWSALHVNTDMVRLVLDHGADVNGTCCWSTGPM
jgi:ankyrin repeat protein